MRKAVYPLRVQRLGKRHGILLKVQFMKLPGGYPQWRRLLSRTRARRVACYGANGGGVYQIVPAGSRANAGVVSKSATSSIGNLTVYDSAHHLEKSFFISATRDLSATSTESGV
ncbi:MAG: hypothetical protein IKB52_04370, partial [Kiritimatiellae bacterium]|nr:hypothetical protein [Kiritimatiellia bacterium]